MPEIYNIDEWRVSEKRKSELQRFFPDRATMLIFALLNSDSRLRREMLGLGAEMYYDKEICQKWYDDINSAIRIIGSNAFDERDIESASNKLNEMYSNIMEAYEEDYSDHNKEDIYIQYHPGEYEIYEVTKF